MLIEFIFTDVIDRQKKKDYKRPAGVRESPKRVKLEIPGSWNRQTECTMDNRSVAGYMDFNLQIDSFASPHSLLHVSSQLSDHTMATSANRYVKLQDYYFSVCGFCFAVQVNLKRDRKSVV